MIATGLYLNHSTKETPVPEEESDTKNVPKIGRTLSEEEALEIGYDLWNFAFNIYWDGTCDITPQEINSKIWDDANILAPSPVDIINLQTFLHPNGEDCHGVGRDKLHHYKKTTLEYRGQLDNEIDFVAYTELCQETICTEDSETVKTIDGDFYVSPKDDGWALYRFYLPVLPEE